MTWEQYIRQVAMPEGYAPVDYGPGGDADWSTRNPSHIINGPTVYTARGMRYPNAVPYRDTNQIEFPESYIDYLLNGPVRAGEIR